MNTKYRPISAVCPKAAIYRQLVDVIGRSSIHFKETLLYSETVKMPINQRTCCRAS